MIKNYFHETIRFHPEHLKTLEPAVQVSEVTMPRDEASRKVRGIDFTVRGFRYRAEYNPAYDAFRVVFPMQYGFERTVLPYFNADTLLDAVEHGINHFEDEIFLNYVTYIVANTFKTPYTYHTVDVVKRDNNKKVAQLLIGGLVKAVIAYRPADKESFKMRLASPSGVVKIEDLTLWGVTSKTRKAVAMIFRGEG